MLRATSPYAQCLRHVLQGALQAVLKDVVWWVAALLCLSIYLVCKSKLSGSLVSWVPVKFQSLWVTKIREESYMHYLWNIVHSEVTESVFLFPRISILFIVIFVEIKWSAASDRGWALVSSLRGVLDCLRKDSSQALRELIPFKRFCYETADWVILWQSWYVCTNL